MNVPLRLGALLLVVLMIQVTVFVDVRFLGVAPELLSLVAIIGAFYVGPERGPVLAFGAGVVWDVYLPTPLGVTAITLAIAAYLVATLNEGLFHDTRSQLMLMVGLSSAGVVIGYALLGGIMGTPGLLQVEMFRIALLVCLVNASLTPLAAPAMVWALGGEDAVR